MTELHRPPAGCGKVVAIGHSACRPLRRPIRRCRRRRQSCAAAPTRVLCRPCKPGWRLMGLCRGVEPVRGLLVGGCWHEWPTELRKLPIGWGRVASPDAPVGHRPARSPDERGYGPAARHRRSGAFASLAHQSSGSHGLLTGLNRAGRRAVAGAHPGGGQRGRGLQGRLNPARQSPTGQSPAGEAGRQGSIA